MCFWLGEISLSDPILHMMLADSKQSGQKDCYGSKEALEARKHD
jgi:hypothetical protein